MRKKPRKEMKKLKREKKKLKREKKKLKKEIKKQRKKIQVIQLNQKMKPKIMQKLLHYFCHILVYYSYSKKSK